MPDSSLVQAKSLTVYFDKTVVFREFSASIQPGEHLVLVGENGSGKSTLLKLFAGEIRLSQIPLEGLDNNGSIFWNFDGKDETSVLAAKEHVRLVSPAQQNTYVRQGWRISGEEIILSGFYNTPLLYSAATEKEKNEARQLAQQAGVSHLLTMLAPDMSQGQLRAMLILRAMVARPKLLLLDEPMEGLDATAKALLTQLMRMAAERGCTLLVTAHRHGDIPQWMTAICTVGPHGLAPIPHFPDFQTSRIPQTSKISRTLKIPRTPQIAEASRTAGASEISGIPGISGTPWPTQRHSDLFDQLFPPRPSASAAKGTRPHIEVTNPPEDKGAMPPHPSLPLPDLVTLDNVEVYIDRTLILENINWHIVEGQHWLVLGENGSGKSTLLRLLHGEEFAAWGGSLRWFGQASLPLAQLQKSVGYVSDRLHSLYTYNMSARDVILSGADGSIGIYRDLSPEELIRAEQLIDYFEITPFAHNLFHSLSSGQGRRVLLARALVGSPRVLLLDEPFSGLDSQNRALWLHTLTLLAERGVSIIFVSHHEDEYGDFFTHQITLAHGKIVEKKTL